MRQDYCPIGGAPCQSMCDEPCLSTAKKRIAELENQVKELEENLDIEREEIQSLQSDIDGYENDEVKLNEQIKQLREALQGFLDAFNGGYEPSLQTVFIASKAMERTK